MATNYTRGATFERKVARNLEEWGYVTVRSAGSHSPADVVAMQDGATVCVQCKCDGRLGPKEWNDFFDWCEKGGTTPILAAQAKTLSGIIYYRLTSRKDGRGRQPWESWTPQIEGY